MRNSPILNAALLLNGKASGGHDINQNDHYNPQCLRASIAMHSARSGGLFINGRQSA